MPLSSNFCNGSILGKAGMSSHKGEDQDRLSPQPAVPRAQPFQNLASTRSCPAVVGGASACRNQATETANVITVLPIRVPIGFFRILIDPLRTQTQFWRLQSTVLQSGTTFRPGPQQHLRFGRISHFSSHSESYAAYAVLCAVGDGQKKYEGRSGSRRGRSPFRLFSGGGPHLVTGISSQHGHTIHLPGTLRSRERPPPLFGLCFFSRTRQTAAVSHQLAVSAG